MRFDHWSESWNDTGKCPEKK